ncbi:hypothetical protein SLEP1_g1718 [Rubroshorea leprosula]|uniref:Uncharacterized protein n=1 Tax=Rubroshorea leprosula TaxID=152421 RepID=A0AAV5HQ43_9ROSI|nr:hypothetical protein SLEP1_g1718 [Rubroshorea leprosula]
MLEPPGFLAVQAWLEPNCAPSSDDPSGFGGGPLHPAASLVEVYAGDPRFGNLATHLLPPGIGLRRIRSLHQHPGAWRTFHMGRLKGVLFGSLDRRPLYSWVLSGCSSVLCTSLRPLEMGLL